METPAQILKRHGLRPKHSWGQNFLGDERVLHRIAEVASPLAGEPLVELGPGLGHLTRFLLDTGATVVAIERDRDMVSVLEKDLVHPRFRVVGANATDVQYAKVAGAPRVALVGNIPYHLTSPILFAALEQRTSITQVVLTLQKEVAVRLSSEPGGRDYGLLPAILGLFFDLGLVMDVPRGLFHPPPNVDSAVIRLKALDEPRAEVTSDVRFVRVVKAAFSQRRKTLQNALRSDPGLGGPEAIATALSGSGIDGGRRAETLWPTEFAALERALPVAKKG